MKSRPILFNGAMVRALLDGSKTQTRRVAKGERASRGMESGWYLKPYGFVTNQQFAKAACPYGQPGDRLWVRESYMPDPDDDGTWAYTQYMGCKGSPLSDIPMKFRKPENCIYRATWDGPELAGWKPSIHMPRWASRILLEIVSVRVERLNDISEEDSRAEGITDGGCLSCGEPEPCSCTMPMPDAMDAYCHLWGQINGPDSWAANPWVWCISFRRIQP